MFGKDAAILVSMDDEVFLVSMAGWHCICLGRMQWLSTCVQTNAVIFCVFKAKSRDFLMYTAILVSMNDAMFFFLYENEGCSGFLCVYKHVGFLCGGKMWQFLCHHP